MNNKYKYFTLIFFLGLFITISSCKDDNDELIIKRNGNITVTILDGEQPVSNKKVKVSNASSGKLFDIITTNTNGEISLNNVLEGNYAFSIEVTEPNYANFSKQFQVISGESRTVVFQTRDLSSSLTLFLVDNFNKNIIKENVNVGIAIIPNGINFDQAFSNAEKIALASSIKYFEQEGTVSFENIPYGTYQIFRVKADTIEKRVTSLYLKPQIENIYQVKTLLAHERVFRKVWDVQSAINISNSEAVSNFPFTSFKFFTTDSGDKVELSMENGVKFVGNFSLTNEGFYYIESLTSNNPEYSINISNNGSCEMYFDGTQLLMKFRDMRLNTSENTSYFMDIRVRLK